jgi:tyrosine-protein kinase Etk/Wzc
MINDEIDIGLLLAITRQNVLAIVILFTFFAFVAFLYLRFTPPIYQSIATVQLGADSRTNALLNAPNIHNQGIHQEIEYLRSPVSIKKSLSKLPLDVSYMIKGEVLSSELYQTSPYTIGYDILNPAIYNQTIKLDFLPNYRVYIEYTLGDKIVSLESSMLDSIKTEHLEFQLLVNNYERIIENQNEDQNEFFFTINSEQHNLNKYYK